MEQWMKDATKLALKTWRSGNDKYAIILDAIKECYAARHAPATQLSVEDCNKAYTDLTKAANEEGSKLVSAEFSENDRHLMLMERYRGRADVYLELSQRHASAAAPASEREAENAALRTQLEEVKNGLKDLLAIIHRDGGHHTADVGIKQSVDDAHKVWAALQFRVTVLEDALRKIVLMPISVSNNDAREMQNIAHAVLTPAAPKEAEHELDED